MVGSENINEEGEINLRRCSKCQEYAQNNISAQPHVQRNGIGKNELENIKRLHAQQPETLKHQNDEIFLV
jgi:hypothetical protein